MMNRLLNTMRAQALMAQSGKASVRLGLVSSYDPANYCVKVRLQPEDFETGWLPLAAPWVGNGWGMFCPPTPGDMVEIQFQEGSAEAGIACLRLYNDSDRPLSVPSGEFWLVHASGAYLKLTNDGKVSLSAGTEIDIGNLGSAVHALVTDAMVALFNGHTHPLTVGNTGAPNQTMGASHMTTVLKAN